MIKLKRIGNARNLYCNWLFIQERIYVEIHKYNIEKKLEIMYTYVGVGTQKSKGIKY